VCFWASGKTLTLTGNLFYGNTASYRNPVVEVYDGNGDVSASYNVVNVAYGTGTTQCGWDAGTGDIQISSLPINTTTFRPTVTALNIVPVNTPDFPATDFYGNDRSPYPTAAGAVEQ
jgi:hypothetical protein